MFADAHCHLSFPAFDEDRPAVIERMKEAGVTLLIDPGVNAETSRTSIDLARKHSFIHANVGLHPHDADSGIEAATFDELQQLARYPEVVAIGEIGLDYHYPETSPENQQEAFRTMLRMARSLNLPVVIHSPMHGRTPCGFLMKSTIRHSGASCTAFLATCIPHRNASKGASASPYQAPLPTNAPPFPKWSGQSLLRAF